MNLTFGDIHRLGKFGITAFAPMDERLLAGADSPHETDIRPVAVLFDEDGDPTQKIGSTAAGDTALAVAVLSTTKFVLFSTSYAWVCTWNGASIGRGSACALPMTFGYLAATALSGTVVVGAGYSPTSGTPGRAFIGIVSGNSVTFYNTAQFSSTWSLTPRICAIDEDRFLITYGTTSTEEAFYIAGTRSGGTSLTFGTAVEETGQYPHDNPATEATRVSSTMMLAAFKGVDGYPKTRCIEVEGTSLSLSSIAAMDSEESYTYQHGIGAMPPIYDGLWPRWFVVTYMKDRYWISPRWRGGMYATLGRIDSDGAITVLDTAVYCDLQDGLSDYYLQLFMMPLSQWTFALGWKHRIGSGPGSVQYRELKHAEITPFALNQTLTLDETLEATDGHSLALSKILSDDLGLSDAAQVNIGEIAGETLALADEAELHGVYLSVLSEELGLSDEVVTDGYFSVSDVLALADDVRLDMGVVAAETMKIYERLRLKGDCIDPRTRLFASILGGIIRAERTE